MNELKSYTEYAVSTPTSDFVIGFDFNYGEDAVNVTIDNVPAQEAGYTVVYLDESTIQLTPSVSSGVVRLQRETDIDQSDHTYRAGAKFIAKTMDENFEQLRHSQQEVRDGFSKLATDTYALINGLDEALELAQDAAQDAQDAAVIAQAAADTVNAIIVDGKVSADKVLDESGLSQQHWNNGVESIADLLAIPSPKNGSRVFVKSRNSGTGKGGGYFEFHADSEKDDGGVFFKTSTGSWHRITTDVWRNVQWYGAVGDGVTDDLPSLNLAVASFGTLDWNGNSNPSSGSHSTLYMPASDGAYCVSDTLYLLPYMTLKGDSFRGGSLSQIYTPNTTIKPIFGAGTHYKWVISTLNRTRSDGLLTTWDSVYSGTAYDTGVVTGCFGTSVQDLTVLNTDTSSLIYGGIRMQNAPQCSVKNCRVVGFDVGVFSCGSWDSVFDVSTESFKCGLFLYADMNSVQIDGYQHPLTSRIPLANQLWFLNTNDTTSGLSFDMSTQTYGVYLTYGYGFASKSLIAEGFDVGFFVSQSTGSFQSLYSERNGLTMAAVASAITINSIAGVSNQATFELGTGADIDLKAIVSDHSPTMIRHASIYYSYLKLPRTIDAPYNPHIVTDRSVVYLDSVNGNDSNSGLVSYRACATLTKALQIASNIDVFTLAMDQAQEVIRNVTIIILDGANHRLSNWAVVSSVNLQIVSTQSPTILVGEKNFNLRDAKMTLNGVNITRENVNTWQGSQGAFICRGECAVTVKANYVHLDYPLVSVTGSDVASIDLKVLGGVGNMGAPAKWVESTSLNAGVKVFVRCTANGNNINTSADSGVAVPASALIYKNVASVA